MDGKKEEDHMAKIIVTLEQIVRDEGLEHLTGKPESYQLPGADYKATVKALLDARFELVGDPLLG